MEFGSELLYSSDTKKPEYELVPESRFNHIVQAVSSGYSSVSADYHDDDGEVGTKLKVYVMNCDTLSFSRADVSPGHFGHSRSRRLFGYERPSKKRTIPLISM